MPMRRPPLMRAYALGGRAFFPILRWVLTRKHLREGGPAGRVAERFGIAAQDRPDGPLIWIHAVSVGEAMSVMELCADLAERFNVLLTTTSVTSAQLAETRLPNGVRHQFAPIDSPVAVTRFLDSWRPDLVVLTESELWPVTLAELDNRGIPVAVVNGRMSEKSTRLWSRIAPGVARAVLSRMVLILAQDSGSAARFVELGSDPACTEVGGSLKSAAERLPVDPEARAAAREWAQRPLWLAASTHEGEEELVLAAHVEILKVHPDTLLVLAPRHPNRATAVSSLIAQSQLRFEQRSTGGIPSPGTEVYLADTLGELGLWFEICKAVLMGGSLLPGIGGHNPMEPARFGCAILSGPHVENAADLYADLVQKGRARLIDPAPLELAPAILAAMAAPQGAPIDESGAMVAGISERLAALV